MSFPHLPQRTVTSLFLLLLAGCALLAPAASARERESTPYQKLERVRLLPNKANDGDSFHASADGKEFIFRLYQVDTPETEKEFPERVKDQATYFGITPDEAVRIGKVAEAFTHEKLAAKPFTVYTRWEDARGASRLPRYYAWIVVEDKTLEELLVANGLARIFGMPGNSPAGMNSSAFKAHLKTLEEKAKHDHLGAWSIHAGKSDAAPEGGGDAFDKFFAKPPAAGASPSPTP